MYTNICTYISLYIVNHQEYYYRGKQKMSLYFPISELVTLTLGDHSSHVTTKIIVHSPTNVRSTHGKILLTKEFYHLTPCSNCILKANLEKKEPLIVIGNPQIYGKTSIYYEITRVLKEKKHVFHLYHFSCPHKSGTMEQNPVLNSFILMPYFACALRTLFVKIR